MLAVENVGHAGEARLHHRDRSDAVSRAHAGKVECLLDVVLVARPAPEARDLLRRVRQREAHAFLVKMRERRCSAHGAKRGAGPLGAAMSGAHVIGAERHQEATTQVIAEHDGPNQLGARPALSFGHRKCRGYDRRSRDALW